MGPLIVHLVFTLLFCILGVILIRGKGAFLIAGYNTSSPQEKAMYNEKALCQAVGAMMFACAICFLISGIGSYFELLFLCWAGYTLLLIAVIVGMIFVNTSKRLKRK